MIFTESPLKGAFVIGLERREDERGFFARAFCQKEFAAHGLEFACAQTNVSANVVRGTVRGMHFQFPPVADTKLIRCTRGAMYDVIVDLRPESPTYLRHFAVELTDDNGLALYVPRRFAHGYQALADRTETTYQAGEFFVPDSTGGVRFDDPRLAIRWPLPVTLVSPQDRIYPLLATGEAELRCRMSRPAPRKSHAQPEVTSPC
jgi:dTDP-4-dehydrorhamnose 3,5-epimerase